jgi:hypothetical protein
MRSLLHAPSLGAEIPARKTEQAAYCFRGSSQELRALLAVPRFVAADWRDCEQDPRISHGWSGVKFITRSAASGHNAFSAFNSNHLNFLGFLVGGVGVNKDELVEIQFLKR